MDKLALQKMLFSSKYTTKGYNGGTGRIPTRIQVDEKSHVDEDNIDCVLKDLRWTEARVMIYILSKTINTKRGLVELDSKKDISKEIDVCPSGIDYALKTMSNRGILEKKSLGVYRLNIADWIAKCS